MGTPSLFPTRRPSPAVRIKLHLAFAAAWEALVETYSTQAAHFVTTLAHRLDVEEALQRFFREVSVPAAMHEPVRARAWLLLADSLPSDEALESDQHADRWSLRWTDVTLDAVRRRVHFVDETNLACRLAASAADEVVCTTHVRNALRVVEVLAETTPLEDALNQYVRTFNLSAVPAQLVFQRCLAQLADRHPLLDATVALEMTGEAEPRSVRPPAALPSPLSVFG